MRLLGKGKEQAQRLVPSAWGGEGVGKDDKEKGDGKSRGAEGEEEMVVLASRLDIVLVVAVVVFVFICSVSFSVSSFLSIFPSTTAGGASETFCAASTFGCGSAGLAIARQMIKL